MCQGSGVIACVFKKQKNPTNLARPKIAGMSLVVERPHKYDSAIFINKGLKVKNVSVRAEGNVKLITVVMPEVAVHSVYKPPNTRLPKYATHCNRRF